MIGIKLYTPRRMLFASIVLACIFFAGVYRNIKISQPITETSITISGATDFAIKNPVDVGFSQEMAQHHLQAILLSKLAMRMASPALQIAAQRIYEEQLQQMGIFHGWMLLWGVPSTPSGKLMGWMSLPRSKSPQELVYAQFLSSCANSQQVPGTLSATDFSSLERSEGLDFDNKFVSAMISHHQGAIIMASYAREFGETLQVKLIATQIMVNQKREISDLQMVLQHLNGN